MQQQCCRCTTQLRTLPGTAIWETMNGYADIHRYQRQNASLRDTLMEGVDLYGAILTGVDFTSADLTGSRLTGSSTAGANLEDATLEGALMPNGRLWQTDEQTTAGKESSDPHEP